MGKFDGVLLASDFDNTILNTERPRRTGGKGRVVVWDKGADPHHFRLKIS